MLNAQDPLSLNNGTIPTTDLFKGSAVVSCSAVSKYKNPGKPSNPHEEQEVFDSIDDKYFNDEAFDTSLYELETLPDEVNLERVAEDRMKFGQQLRMVSKRVSQLILKNHQSYATELEHVMELQRTLQSARSICVNSRGLLQYAQQSFTIASLGLLANYRKRQQLKNLIQSLATIKTLQKTSVRLRELLEEEDYTGAIHVCLECQKAASTFRHYTCISELNSKLQDTLELIEELLDVALSKVCRSFDAGHYEKVQKAYNLLRKTQTSMDQLHMHFASAIHNTAFTIVLGHVELCSGPSGSNFHKRPYPDLCKNISIKSFTPCLLDLCKALWGVMKSYYQTLQWHEAHDHQVPQQPDSTFNHRLVMQKLEYGRGRLWQDAQQKVKTFIVASDLSNFKFDEFIHVLDMIDRLIRIGQEFCGSKSEGLQDSLKQQSLNYFRSHHRMRLEELRMFLENEAWELCPVRHTFNALQLTEFRFLRDAVVKERPPMEDNMPDRHDPERDGDGQAFFRQYARDGSSPFDVQPCHFDDEDVFSGSRDGLDDRHDGDDSDGSEDGTSDALKRDYIDEVTGEAHSYRTVTTTSNSNAHPQHIVTTNYGKYLQMISVLQPIAFDVVSGMSQLFDYYFYTVAALYFQVGSFFATDGISPDNQSTNNRLLATLNRIQDTLISTSPSVQSDGTWKAVHAASLLSVVDVKSATCMFGLAERTVAVESLIFLAQQLVMLEGHLAVWIPPSRKAFLQTFYSQTVKMAVELRGPVYHPVAARAINYDHVLQQMSGVRWDVKEIMSEHNAYVDNLLTSLVDVKSRVEQIAVRVRLPSEAVDVFWRHCITLVNHTFVEGFAQSRRCSNEGRALMQLDFQQFLSKFHHIMLLRPIPEREYVEGYIKAYYLPESRLEDWVLEHKEYSTKQLLSLVSCVCHLSRKARQHISAIVEDTSEKVKR